MSCLLCQRVERISQHEYHFLIKEFKHSYLMLGEHQYYPGYCVLVSKKHYREMTDMPKNERDEFFQEMMQSHEWLIEVFHPTKMNMCSLGNVVDHIHWHFFPRHSHDPNFKSPPWLQMHLFDAAKTTDEERVELIKKIRAVIKS